MKSSKNLSFYTQVFLALAMAAIGVSQSSTLTSDSSKAKSAASSIFAIIDRKSRIDPSEDAGVTVEALQGNIVSYEARCSDIPGPLLDNSCWKGK